MNTGNSSLSILVRCPWYVTVQPATNQIYLKLYVSFTYSPTLFQLPSPWVFLCWRNDTSLCWDNHHICTQTLHVWPRFCRRLEEPGSRNMDLSLPTTLLGSSKWTAFKICKQLNLSSSRAAEWKSKPCFSGLCGNLMATWFQPGCHLFWCIKRKPGKLTKCFLESLYDGAVGNPPQELVRNTSWHIWNRLYTQNVFLLFFF